MDAIRLVCTMLAAGALSAQVVDTQTVTKRFPLQGGAAPEVVVHLITGDIRVTAHAANEVSLVAKVRLEANDAAELDRLKRDVTLESEQSGNNVWIGVETKDNWNNRRARRELGWRGKTAAGESRSEGKRWSFRHDVELRVPRNAHLKLSTVNGGGIAMDGVAGEFHLNNVNGGIDVKRAHAPGRAHTVNGGITIGYETNPGGPVSVKTVNGKVVLSFPRNLNADFQFKTFNGSVHSDFPMTASAVQKVETSERGMKRIWRTSGRTGGRVGNGGPVIDVDSFNGGIEVLQNK